MQILTCGSSHCGSGTTDPTDISICGDGINFSSTVPADGGLLSRYT
ncbi:MAG: hypothetical protein HRT38_19215 [Alteromonadaceae bacterium]|nr:hypothetical protein [Alteromonadaceae bacterium]